MDVTGHVCNNSSSGVKTQSDFVGLLHKNTSCKAGNRRAAPIKKSLRPSVPTTPVLNGFLQNFIPVVPLQRTDGFNFHSDRTGRSEAHV